jgi:hypothetical protein
MRDGAGLAHLASPNGKCHASAGNSAERELAGKGSLGETFWTRVSGRRSTPVFLSGSPTTSIVGATANLLLSVDEAQDILIDKYDKEIAPMAASTNATRVFWGTAWTANTLLAREEKAAGIQQEADGIQRVWRLTCDLVAAEVPCLWEIRGRTGRQARAASPYGADTVLFRGH